MVSDWFRLISTSLVLSVLDGNLVRADPNNRKLVATVQQGARSGPEMFEIKLISNSDGSYTYKSQEGWTEEGLCCCRWRLELPGLGLKCQQTHPGGWDGCENLRGYTGPLCRSPAKIKQRTQHLCSSCWCLWKHTNFREGSLCKPPPTHTHTPV